MGRDTSEGITLLEGRDPDGLPVMIVYPRAEPCVPPVRAIYLRQFSRQRADLPENDPGVFRGEGNGSDQAGRGRP
jgi:hypothetical protein